MALRCGKCKQKARQDSVNRGTAFAFRCACRVVIVSAKDNTVKVNRPAPAADYVKVEFFDATVVSLPFEVKP